MPTKDDSYWCSIEAHEAAQEGEQRTKIYREALKTSGMAQKMAKGVRVLHGLSGGTFGPDASQIGRGGTRAQKAEVRFNEVGSLARSVTNLVAQQVPGLTVVPSNTDYSTLAQLAKTKRYFRWSFDHYRVPDHLFNAVWWSHPYSVMYLLTGWNPWGGNPINPEAEQVESQDVEQEGAQEDQGDTEGEPDEPESPNPLIPSQKTTGCMQVGVYRPIDVTSDLGVADDEHDWRIIRDVVNKREYCARYPDAKNAILDAPLASSEGGWNWDDFSPVRNYSLAKGQSDRIAIYTLLHRRTAAMPEGRMLSWVDTTEEGVLFDGALPFARVPLTSIHSGRIAGTPWYDSPFWQILGAQEV